jgi:hypothetical protein
MWRSLTAAGHPIAQALGTGSGAPGVCRPAGIHPRGRQPSAGPITVLWSRDQRKDSEPVEGNGHEPNAGGLRRVQITPTPSPPSRSAVRGRGGASRAGPGGSRALAADDRHAEVSGRALTVADLAEAGEFAFGGCEAGLEAFASPSQPFIFASVMRSVRLRMTPISRSRWRGSTRSMGQRMQA